MPVKVRGQDASKGPAPATPPAPAPPEQASAPLPDAIHPGDWFALLFWTACALVLAALLLGDLVLALFRW